MPDEKGAPTRASAAQLELLIDNVVDYAIFFLEPDGTIASWNRGAEQIKGYRPDEIIGSHFSRFYTDEDRARDHPSYELEVATREGKFEEEGWRVRKDGSRFWANVVITAVRDRAGELVGFGKVTRDLTARRLNEEQLRGTAANLRAANAGLVEFRRMIAGVRDYAIFMLDAGGHITTWNAGAEHIKGYSAEEAIGRHFSLFYTDEDRERNHPAYELEVAAREGRYAEEGWRVRKDGTRLWASVTITAIRNEEGILTGFSKVTRDLSERRSAEERLVEAERELRRSNAELERFAAVAAHDLRDPLTTIGSFAQLLRETEGDRLTEKGRGHLDMLSSTVSELQTMIEDLLTFARLGSATVELAPVPLAPAVGRVLARLDAAIAGSGAAIVIDVPDEAAVLVDRMGVDLLLQNLVANAIKFGSKDGPHIAVAAEPADGGWRVTVTDDGAGIAEPDRERIFEAFERVRGTEPHAGQGLGLSICRRVVERSGGTIGVESAPGGGSRFWCWLPEGPG